MPLPKQLFVLRHAKSSWDDPSLADDERPLAPRGQKATKLLAQHVRAHHIEPEQVLCSPAVRTRQTFDGVAPGGELIVEPELYAASGEALVERLRRVPEEICSVMVIGHNPALQMLVLRLAATDGAPSPDLVVAESGRSSDPLAEVRRRFPTGALATLTFQCAWSELRPGRARLTGLVRPRDLH
jgi:phosphohistidine phosphatase